MARKKKKKLVVELDLPKDDNTLKNLYIVIFFSVILGLSSGIMWITNSGFIPTANGEPMFTNVTAEQRQRIIWELISLRNLVVQSSHHTKQMNLVRFSKIIPIHYNGQKIHGRTSWPRLNPLMFQECQTRSEETL